MRIALIDLGTNSVRFDVQLLNDKGANRILHREKVMVRLGEGVYQSGKLSESAIERTITTLRHFKKTADELGAERIIAVGTSALRDARDGAAFAARVQAEAGIELKIISGVEEAQLIALGVLKNEAPPKGYYALVDIGGGSTEISLVRGRDVVSSLSFRLGTARLTQLFLKSIPPRKERSDSPHPIDALRHHIRETLAAEPICKIWPDAKLVIGSSGTIRSLVRLKKGLGKRTGKSISRDTLRKLVRQMSEMTTDELRAMPGMSPKRIDMILGGGILLEELMDFLGARKVKITDFSLRDGLLADQLRANGAKNGSKNGKARKALVEQAQPSAALTAKMGLCEQLFQQMNLIHGLDERWLAYALTALFVEGSARSAAERSLRESFVGRLSWLENWERKFIVRLILRESEERTLPPFRSNDPERRRALTTLGTILALCDSLTAKQSRNRANPSRRSALRLDRVFALPERRIPPKLRAISGKSGN